MAGFLRNSFLAVFFTLGAGGSSPHNSEDINIVFIERGSMTFGVSETIPPDSDFFVNSNFFDADGPIGLLVVDGQRKSSRVRNGGFFYVRNGEAFVDSESSPRYTQFNSQTLLSGINDGKINSSLVRASHGKKRTYRTLIGQTRAGDIVFIASGRTGLVTISEILDIAIDNGVHDGILLDGGSSVDYMFGRERFKSVPSFVKEVMGIEEPKAYIYGNFSDI